MKTNLMNTIKIRTILKYIYVIHYYPMLSIVEGVKTRSKSFWYLYSEKFTKFFYGLEKRNAICGTIKKLLNDGKEITTLSGISSTLKNIYEN